MGLMEIELATLDHRERLAEMEGRATRRRPEGPRRTPSGRTHRQAKIDVPVLSVRFGRFRYRLWFTRNVAV